MAKDRPEEDEVEGQKAKPVKKSRLKSVIVVFIVLLILGGGGFFAFKKFGRTVFAKAGDAAAAPKKEEVASVLKLDPFVVNLSDPGGMRYLRVEMAIGLDAELLTPEGKKDKNGDPVLVSEVRDAILQTLSTKKSEDLLSADGKQKLREEMVQTIAPFVKGAKVTGIFFTDFMVQ